MFDSSCPQGAFEGGAGGVRWPDEAAFRRSHPNRSRGREVEFGSRWLAGVDDLPWRASWFEPTGEFVVVECRPGGGVVELLGRVAGRDDVEVALRGWWQMCGHLGSLPWLRSRVQTRFPLDGAPGPGAFSG